MSRPRFTDTRGEARDEIAFHLEMHEQALRDSGLSESEARAEARRRFGNIDQLTRECRRLDRRQARHWRRVDLWGELGTDVALGTRRMIQSPGFSAIALLTLAVGVGVTTALFSVLNAVVLQPLPYQEPDELVVLSAENPKRDFDGVPLPPGAYHRFQEIEAFDGLAAFQAQRLTLTDGEEPRRVTAAEVTDGLLALLGREPVLGRAFSLEDAAAGAERVCLISDDLWRSRFGSDEAVIGQDLRFDDRPYRVVGVLPADMQFPGSLLGQAEVWLPLSLDGQEEEFGSWYLEGMARLGPGVEIEAAQAQLELAAGSLEEQLSFGGGWQFRLTPLEDSVIGQVRPALLVLFGAVVLVLLIACVNLANLLIARTLERGREMQLRVALGAGRLRLARQALTENSLVVLAGGALGLATATVLTPLLVRLGAADLPRIDHLGVNGRVVLFAILATLAAALLSGLLPALQASRLGRTRDSLRSSRISAQSPASTALRSGLVVAEVALAVVLLIGAGLLLRSFDRLLAVEPGFRTDGLLTMTIDLPRSKYTEPEQWRAFFEELHEKVAALATVRQAGQTSALPTRGSFMMDQLHVEGGAEESTDPGPTTAIDVVSPEVLRTLGVPLLEGRWFDHRDHPRAETHIIVNETLARRYFPGESAIGKRILATDDESWQTIVGVVGDVKQFGPREETPLQLYLAQAQHPARRMSLVIRTRNEPLEVAPAVKAIVREIDPGQPVANLATMSAVVAESHTRERFNALLMSLFGVLAAALAALGVYGVIAQSVSRRRHEMGVRAALGANRSDLFRIVLLNGLGLAGIGATFGLIGALLLGRFLEGLLFGVSPSDPLTLVVIVLAVLGLAALACLAPARRATRIDPATALRVD